MMLENDTRLALVRLHYEAWLGMTSWGSFEEALAAPAKTLMGREAAEAFVFLYFTGIDREVLKALVSGNLDLLEAAQEAAYKALSRNPDLSANLDGTYTRGLFGA